MAFRIAELGRDNVLCHQSHDEYRSDRGTPPSSSASLILTSSACLALDKDPLDNQDIHRLWSSSLSFPFFSVFDFFLAGTENWEPMPAENCWLAVPAMVLFLKFGRFDELDAVNRGEKAEQESICVCK